MKLANSEAELIEHCAIPASTGRSDNGFRLTAQIGVFPNGGIQIASIPFSVGRYPLFFEIAAIDMILYYATQPPCWYWPQSRYDFR